jgi:uncharacterized membrane protein YhaH (DUF805 family)
MLDLLFGFQGRINRQKWWLVGIAVPIVSGILFGIVFYGTGMLASQDPGAGPGFLIMGAGAVLSLAMLWISIAVSMKRYHDLNKSGWWICIVLVPVIGHLWYLIESGFLPGTRGANSYGADPLSSL